MSVSDDDTQLQLQQKHLQIQVLHQQITQVQKHLQLMEKQLSELGLVKVALADLKKTELDTEILVPLSSGIFIKAALKDNKTVRINVGNDVVAEKSLDQAQDLIARQIDDLTKIKDQLMTDMNNMALQANLLETDLSKKS